MTTSWTIAVDWERSGTFDGIYDDITDDVIEARWFLGMRGPYRDVADASVLSLDGEKPEGELDPLQAQIDAGINRRGHRDGNRAGARSGHRVIGTD